MNSSNISRLGLCALLSGSLFLSACDSAGPSEADVTIGGRVTDDSGYGKAGAANVEGAAVTAVNVSTTGNFTALDGSATTDAQGSYSLELDNAAGVVAVSAEKDDFESSALVVVSGERTVNAVPMTVESDVETEVYVEAKSTDTDNDVTVAGVALYVTQQVAADVRAGNSTVADIAAAIRGGAQARMQYLRAQEEEEGEEYEVDEVKHEEQETYVALQADLSASTNTTAQAQALAAFEEALIQAYQDAGVSAETHAKARVTGRAAVVEMGADASADAHFQMQKRAEVLTAWASALAVEAAFQADEAASAQLQALQAARADLVADLRAAVSAEAIAGAKSDYEAAVEQALATEMDVTVEAVASAGAGLAALEAALSTAIGLAVDAEAIVEAYTTFFASAEAAVAAAFAANDRADLAAEVLTLVAVL